MASTLICADCPAEVVGESEAEPATGEKEMLIIEGVSAWVAGILVSSEVLPVSPSGVSSANADIFIIGFIVRKVSNRSNKQLVPPIFPNWLCLVF